MATRTGVIRLERDGPESIGLERLELDPKDFETALPDQHWHLYFEDSEQGVTVGVWTTTDMREAFGPYPGDEFMVVLEGRVVIDDGKGGETAVEAGQSFTIRNAIPVSWVQTGFQRKAFIIHLDPHAPTPEIASAEGGVIVLDPARIVAEVEPVADSIGGGAQRDFPVFTSDSGAMTVGMWESSAFKTVMQPFSYHELAQILEGSVSITTEDGVEQRFGPGDVFFVAAGTVCRWSADGPVTKLYAAVEPAG